MIEFDLYTDGSCSSRDGMGGYCAVLLDNRTQDRYAVFGASNHTSVPRQEFTALFHGLEKIFELMGWKTEKDAAQGAEHGISVKWYCDREDLVMSVDQRRTGYKRRAYPDLWARYEYYERFIRVVPVKVPRNTLPFQTLSDKVAGEMRMKVKHYLLEEGKLKLFRTLK